MQGIEPSDFGLGKRREPIPDHKSDSREVFVEREAIRREQEAIRLALKLMNARDPNGAIALVRTLNGTVARGSEACSSEKRTSPSDAKVKLGPSRTSRRWWIGLFVLSPPS
jgi:hypothetical protein